MGILVLGLYPSWKVLQQLQGQSLHLERELSYLEDQKVLLSQLGQWRPTNALPTLPLARRLQQITQESRQYRQQVIRVQHLESHAFSGFQEHQVRFLLRGPLFPLLQYLGHLEESPLDIRILACRIEKADHSPEVLTEVTLALLERSPLVKPKEASP